MQRILLIILLLVFSCEEPAIEGCTHPTACNYNADATLEDESCVDPQGCNEWCEGDSLQAQELDCAGVCGGNGCYNQDCITWSSESYNCDGTCGGENDTVEDCAGVCGGLAVEDCAGVCGGDGIDSDNDGICDNIDECIGVYDACNVCNGSGKNYICDGSGWNVCDETECPEPYTCSCGNWDQQNVCSLGVGNGYNACGSNKNPICIEDYPNCSECNCE